jgi:hypothetical protein
MSRLPNSPADTCLCRYELHWTSKGAGTDHEIVDILSNATVASYDTTLPNSEAYQRQYQAAVLAMEQDRPLPPLPNETPKRQRWRHGGLGSSLNCNTDVAG